MEAGTLKIAWLIPALALTLLPAADAASNSHSSQASSGHSESHKSRSKKSASKCSTCTRDHHGKIKRSGKAKHDFERQSGYPHGRKGYVVDHIRPLECGGADVPSNMQWQTIAEAKAKDRTERTCR